MFSKGIFQANWKRFWMIPVVTTIILFLGITFQMVLEVEERKEIKSKNTYINRVTAEESIEQNVIQISNTVNKVENTTTQVVSTPKVDNTKTDTINITKPIDEERYFIKILYNYTNILILFILPVLLAILLFAYMNEEKSNSFIHGLPISKKRLYMTNIMTAITMYVLPYVINMIILIILNFGEMGEYIQTVQLWKWFGISLLYHTVFFSFSTCIGMLCASKISHGILTYIFMYAPIIMIVILSQILEKLIYGFYAFSTQLREITMQIPFIKVIEIFQSMNWYYKNFELAEVFGIKTVVSYLVASVVMIGIGYILYRKRKLEITKEFIVYRTIQSIIKYVATFGVNLLSYLYFYEIWEEDKIKSIIGSIIITFIAYIIIDMILKKTYKVQKGIKGGCIYSISIMVLYIIVANGFLGFETRIPELEKIKEVAMVKDEEKTVWKEKENIKHIIDFHQNIVNERKDGYSEYIIEYTLENGSKLSRRYELSTQEYQEEFKTLYTSDEYQKETTKFLENLSQIEEIEIMVTYKDENQEYDRKTIVLEESKKEEFISLLWKDIHNKKAIAVTIYSIQSLASQKIGNIEITNLNIRFEMKDDTYERIIYTNFEEMEIYDMLSLQSF